MGERARQDLAGRVQPAVGATIAREPVEVVVCGGLADILHPGVVVATHMQRPRVEHADRAPRALTQRRARDATGILTSSDTGTQRVLSGPVRHEIEQGELLAEAIKDLQSRPSGRVRAAIG